MSKNEFKTLINRKIIQHTLSYLNEEKSKLSKVSHIQFDELSIQNYLKPDSGLTVQESQFIFVAQCRMLQVK